jgi:hypothetical protein
MEVRVEKKGQQPKKIDCSRMLVNAGHPMDKKATGAVMGTGSLWPVHYPCVLMIS